MCNTPCLSLFIRFPKVAFKFETMQVFALLEGGGGGGGRGGVS